MESVELVIGFLLGLSGLQGFAWFALLNAVVVALGLAGGSVLLLIPARTVAGPPPGLTAKEVWLATLCGLLNTLITFVGWLFWKHEIIQFRETTAPLVVLLDVALLLLVMDAAMYVLHRLAHHRLLFGVLHALHHEYPLPRPLTLFVLHPFETLGFGALWLTVISLYDATWLGMAIYLVLNVAFGIVGHLGVEHAPRAWAKAPLATAAFHAGHHLRTSENYGFYTSIWDRLFRTYADPERER